MSLVIQGNPANVTGSLVATVGSLSNNGSGAIRVITTAPHLFGNGDTVLMDTSNTASNGTWVITVISSNEFDLVGSTFTATSTGTATDLSLTPAIQVPTDGDTGSLQLSGMLSSLQALADRTQFLKGLATSAQVQTFTANGSWTCPSGVAWVIALMVGGGGGGESGATGNPEAVDQYIYPGSAGGAGAPVTIRMFGVTPGDSYAVVIGAGGAGGGSTSSSPGLDGSPTSFGGSVSPGGGGAGGGAAVCAGLRQLAAASSSPAFVGLCEPGGTGTAADHVVRPWASFASAYVSGLGTNAISSAPKALGSGGSSCRVIVAGVDVSNSDGQAGLPGLSSILGSSGGTGGTVGSMATEVILGDTNTSFGGGGGGGGGASVNSGGNGGNGGAGAVTGGTPSTGTDGASAASNSGAGGGGGGGGGDGPSAGAAHGNGGAGGSGLLQLFWVQRGGGL